MPKPKPEAITLKPEIVVNGQPEPKPPPQISVAAAKRALEEHRFRENDKRRQRQADDERFIQQLDEGLSVLKRLIERCPRTPTLERCFKLIECWYEDLVPERWYLKRWAKDRNHYPDSRPPSSCPHRPAAGPAAGRRTG
jgi:hypothetical protein